MQVILADSMGLCFGVRDALHTMRTIEKPASITIRGQLVHNPLISAEIHSRGFLSSDESTPTIPSSPTVLITAHGISNRERQTLLAAGKNLIDTTCPLVKKAHDAALRLHAQGRHILVIGKPNHVEIRGLTGDLTSFTILESLHDVRPFPHPNLGVIAQTTAIQQDVHAILSQIKIQNPTADIRFINTICQPTRDRQNAVDRLLDQVDMLVVVGGRNSNNALHLAQRAAQRKIPHVHVEHAAELRAENFTHAQTIGLTAGTSTQAEIIDAVHQRLLDFNAE